MRELLQMDCGVTPVDHVPRRLQFHSWAILGPGPCLVVSAGLFVVAVLVVEVGAERTSPTRGRLSLWLSPSAPMRPLTSFDSRPASLKPTTRAQKATIPNWPRSAPPGARHGQRQS